MNSNRFAVIGGDFRSVMVAHQLADAGFFVSAFGFDDCSLFPSSVCCTHTLKEAVSSSSILVLPLPVCTPEQTKINTPLFSKEITVTELLKQLSSEHIVLGGMLPESFCASLAGKTIPFSDYFAREEFAVANAVPTAEGAIEIALRETPTTLCGSKCLITGYGRIAQLLEKDLFALGAHVSVSARRPESLARARAYGSDAFPLRKLEDKISDFEVVFNTIPSPIFNKTVLKKMNPSALLIDLASKPGGVDFDAAKAFGLNVIWALSLPGKCAPKTAGSIICDTIYNILTETGVLK